MSTQTLPQILPEEELYRSRTPASRRFFVEACRYLPGGDSRSTLFYPPYPAVMARGDGCVLFDIDGNRLLDFTGNHSSLIHGYNHPTVMAAVREQLQKGTCFPGSSEPQLSFARLLCQRIPSIEQVRFTNSGTEATLNAIRAARAFTGRPRIAKV
ncbi:MAG TPA: aminotransferase class III-fold pyridoxal phosphate-dependent enzyme, partial [Gemmatimonadales bacterium]